MEGKAGTWKVRERSLWVSAGFYFTFFSFMCAPLWFPCARSALPRNRYVSATSGLKSPNAPTLASRDSLRIIVALWEKDKMLCGLKVQRSASWLKVIAIVAEDPGSALSTHVIAHNLCNSIPRGSTIALLWPLQASDIHRYTQNIHRYTWSKTHRDMPR